MVIRSAGSEVCAQLRLAMGLRYLAGGQVWDIQSNFLISVSEFYRSLWKSIDAINSIWTVHFDIDDSENIRTLELGFFRKSRKGCISGAIGALDGCLIWHKIPGKVVHNPKRYYGAGKEKFAVLLMDIFDADMKFIWFDMSCTPTTHDSLAWISTDLAYNI